MVEFKDVRMYKCSTCGVWFEALDETLFLTIYSYNKPPQNVGVFCSAKCRRGFTNKLFPKINQPKKRVAC